MSIDKKIKKKIELKQDFPYTSRYSLQFNGNVIAQTCSLFCKKEHKYLVLRDVVWSLNNYFSTSVFEYPKESNPAEIEQIAYDDLVKMAEKLSEIHNNVPIINNTIN